MLAGVASENLPNVSGSTGGGGGGAVGFRVRGFAEVFPVVFPVDLDLRPADDVLPSADEVERFRGGMPRH